MANKQPDMVIKSNQLITASYYLSLSEIRLLDLALAELTDYEECEKHLTLMPDFVEVTAEQYAETYNVSSDMAYKALREASEQLFKRYFSYQVQSEMYPSHKEIRKARWVQEIGYIKGEAVVTLSFTKALIELAGKLKGSFSRYHLEQKAPLTSIYAHRLYEMMLQWRNSKNVPSISYFELRNRFEIPEEDYKRISNFKARVLDPAIKQINELTDIIVSYEQYKKGRKVEGFIFKFKFKKQPEKQKTDTDTKKAKSIESKAFVPLTLGQQVTFASKLANDATFNSKVLQARQGESMKDYTFRVQQALSKYENQVAWLEHLERLGFKATYK